MNFNDFMITNTIKNLFGFKNKLKPQNPMNNLLRKEGECCECKKMLLVFQKIDCPEEREDKEVLFKFGRDTCEECQIKQWWEIMLKQKREKRLYEKEKNRLQKMS